MYSPTNGSPTPRVWKGDSEGQIDSVNQWMRAQPWYQQLLQSFGVRPGAPVNLTDSQRQQLMQTAQQHGAQIDMGNIEVDPGGNFNPKGHKMRNALIAAAIGGGAAFGAPLIAEALGAGGAGAAGGAAAGTIPGATTIGSGFIPGIAGGTGLAGADIGAAAGAAAAGAGAASIPYAAGESGLVPGFGEGGGVLAPLESTGSVGASALPAGSAGVATGGGFLDKAGNVVKKLVGGDNPGDKPTRGDLGTTLGSFADQEAKNRSETGHFMQGYDQLMLNAAQNRRTDESDAMRKLAQTAYINNGGSHFNPTAQLHSGQMVDLGLNPTPISDAEKQGASTLEQQMLARLQPGGSYTPTDPTTYTKPGTAENVAKWGGIASKAGDVLKRLFF